MVMEPPENSTAPTAKPGWDAPKQEQGEYYAQRQPAFSEREAHHMHYLFTKGYWEWVLRRGAVRKNTLCGTPRCRKVFIIIQVEAPTQVTVPERVVDEDPPKWPAGAEA